MTKMTDAIAWFKNQFGSQIAAALDGTPFRANLIAAIALQETYYIWGELYRKLPADEVLLLCVGDTLDYPNRTAFPRRKTNLIAEKDGQAMFAIARQALEDVGTYVAAYRGVARKNANKFCHGYGIFQYDLQHFRRNPEFFLQRQWRDFDACLALCVSVLKAAHKKVYGSRKTTLTDEEQVYVAIAYNSGKVDLAKGFKQGYRDSSGRYYGENVWRYLGVG